MTRHLEPRPELEPLPGRTRAPSRPPPSPGALLLRGLGNRARGRLAAELGAGRRLQRQGWSKSVPGGWNEKARKIGNTWRIPVEGITRGNQAASIKAPARKTPAAPLTQDTPESAAGRAIVLVPPSADLSDGVEVLLQFHGHDVGYRERTDTSGFGVDPGSVRDVEEDLLPQQLEAGQRRMIAVLPQGTHKSKFGIKDPAAYVDEVLALTVPILNTVGRTAGLKQVGVRRIVMSAHSGGGREMVKAAGVLDPGAETTDEQWLRSPPMLLFDAINGPGEVGTAAALMERWLNADLAILTKAGAGARALLAKRGLKLRSMYSDSPMYKATNLGGTYKRSVWKKTTEEVDGKTVTKSEKVEVDITITPEASLRGRRDKWFKRHGPELAALDKLAPTKTATADKDPSEMLKDQYRIDYVGGGHDFILGSGHEATAAERTGTVTQKPTAQVLDVPVAPAKGNLAESVKLLGPAPPLKRAAP